VCPIVKVFSYDASRRLSWRFGITGEFAFNTRLGLLAGLRLSE